MAKERFIERNFSGESLALISRANSIIDEYMAQGFVLTLRQLYYQMVARDILVNKTQSYKRLGSILNDARYAGLVDWSALEDRTRNLKGQSHWDDPAAIIESAASSFALDKWKGQKYRPEIWVEKEALAGVVERAASSNDLSFLSCRGYMSASEMYEAAQRIRMRRRVGRQKTIIIYLGDHDPSGLDMSEGDIPKRFEIFLEKYGQAPVKVKRVALNWDQIEEYQPPPNPAKEPLALDTLIPTPTGWTTMGDIAVGDSVFGLDGHMYKVTGKSDVFSAKPCFKFTFACDGEVICSDDHLWALSARARKDKTLRAADVAKKWHEGKERRPIYRVPIAAPLILPEVKLPIAPYVLGVWLGDGCVGEGRLFCHYIDDEMRDYIEADGFQTARQHEKYCQIYGLRGFLHQLGVAYDKHIPIAYRRASFAQRLELLRGLMDTDGTVADPVYRSNGACQFGNSRRNLAEQCLELVNSLGFRGRLSESRAVLNGQDYGPTWRVEFYPGDYEVFKLKRKQERLAGVKVAERQLWRTLIDVSPVDSVPTQCIAVDSPDHLFLVGEHFIPTHNTDSRFSSYQEEFGDESWELDALDPNTLLAIIQAAVDEVKDFGLFDELKKREDEDREILNKASRLWGDVAIFLEGQ